jgi:hypothetical protein
MPHSPTVIVLSSPQKKKKNWYSCEIYRLQLLSQHFILCYNYLPFENFSCLVSLNRSLRIKVGLCNTVVTAANAISRSNQAIPLS